MKKKFRYCAFSILAILLPACLLLGNSLSIAYNPYTYHTLLLNNPSTSLSGPDKTTVSKALINGVIHNQSIQTKLENGCLAFSEKEIIHMQDVASLIRFLTFLFGVLLIICAVFAWFMFHQKNNRNKFLPFVSILFLLLFGFVVLFTFEKSFTLFHLVSFKNQFWLLDPSKDLLIQLFPESFFYLQFTKVVIMTILELLLLAFLVRVSKK